VATSIPQGKAAINPPTPPAIRVFRGGRIERSRAHDLIKWNGGLVQNKALASRKEKWNKRPHFQAPLKRAPIRSRSRLNAGFRSERRQVLQDLRRFEELLATLLRLALET